MVWLLAFVAFISLTAKKKTWKNCFSWRVHHIEFPANSSVCFSNGNKKFYFTHSLKTTSKLVLKRPVYINFLLVRGINRHSGEKLSVKSLTLKPTSWRLKPVLGTPNVTAALDHVTFSGLPFEVCAKTCSVKYHCSVLQHSQLWLVLEVALVNGLMRCEAKNKSLCVLLLFDRDMCSYFMFL